MFTVVILGFVGLLMLLLGFLMWKFHLAGLIAGYEPEKVKDPEQLAEWTGKCLMANGLLAWLLGLVSYSFDSKNAGLITVVLFMVLTSLSMSITLAGMQRYLK
ncbi:DUF3784 domain-containing protein [Spirosoma fluviale]|uniref:DUF3784 domain-containing protein n=1 Tax=Spirosoma fluviale TaxID=1597977 RepID=A0A286FYL2_9BACT|nr:DUF3784 domain-containing protein [Spirosoma fluviale]SOD88360.1 protein of unknown function [Spirosoma fluviale]